MNKLSPIVLFVYNRPWHTRQTVEALQKNPLAKESELFIFSDGPKDEISINKVLEVRQYLKTISGFMTVTIMERKENIGLARSITEGVTEIVNRFGKIIVLEDDIVTSPFFLEYMNEALEMYQNDEKVISIHGYIFPVKKLLPEIFMLKNPSCWGWATWKRGWKLFESDGKKLITELEQRKLTKKFDFDGSFPYTNMLRRQIAGISNSWAVRWYASAFLKDKLTLYPGKSLVINIGQDGSGTHCGSQNLYKTQLTTEKINVKRLSLEENLEVRKIITQYFKSIKPSIFDRIMMKLKSYIRNAKYN
ncbi:MAG: glycosyltransferase family 2 protein [Nanoarchaeota archaeon]